MTISDLGEHAGEDLQAKILFVPEAIRPTLDDPDLGVDPLDEPQRELLLGLAVRRDPTPVPLHHRGELLEGLEPLPFQRFLPVVAGAVSFSLLLASINRLINILFLAT